MSGLIIISTFMCMQLSLLGLASLRLAIEDLRTFKAMETREVKSRSSGRLLLINLSSNQLPVIFPIFNDWPLK